MFRGNRKAACLAAGVAATAGLALWVGVGFSTLLQAAALGLLAVLAFALPVGWFLALSMLAVMFADSYLLAGQASGVYSYVRFIPLGILAARVALALAARRIPQDRIAWNFAGPFGLLFAYTLVSCLYTENVLVTLLRSLSLGFMVMGLGIGLAARIATWRDFCRELWFLTSVVGVVVTLSLVTLPFLSRPLMELGEYARVRGPFNNPNTLGLMAMLGVFPTLAWWRASDPGWRRRLAAVCSVACTVALVASGSRGSAVGFAAGLCVVLAFRAERRVRALIVAVFAALLLVLMYAPELLPAGITRTDTGLRPQLWSRAIELGMEAPILGVGIGSVDDVFLGDKEHLHALGVYSGGSHNEYLRLFVAVGALGLGLVLVGFARILIRAVRAVRRDPDPFVPVCLLACVVSGMVNGFFEDWILALGGAPAIPFFTFLCMLSIYADRQLRADSYRASPGRLGSRNKVRAIA
jgi:O-antigen ligase